MKDFIISLERAIEIVTIIDYTIKTMNSEIQQIIIENNDIVNYSQTFKDLEYDILTSDFPIVNFSLYKIKFNFTYKEITIRIKDINNIELLKKEIYNILTQKLLEYFQE